MTNQSTVPHTEVSLRMTILSEFLFDEEKSVKELYKSWTRRIGGRIIDFAKFEYWYRRFKNNQFDLGYDTSEDSMEIPEIQDTIVPEANEKKDASTMTIEVKVVERNMEDLKLDHQFEEKNVPHVLQTLGENAVFGVPNAIQVDNESRSETSNVANEVTIDPGYGTTQDSKEISEVQNTIDPEASEAKNDPPVIIEKKDQVEIVKRKIEDLKLNHEFKEENVPQIFKTLINKQSEKLKKIGLYFVEQACTMYFGEFQIDFKEENDEWLICYPNENTVITNDPEKSIVECLWFVLRNPNIKLDYFEIYVEKNPEWMADIQKMDPEVMIRLLKSMFHTLNQQIQTSKLEFTGSNEDLCLSMLQHVQPGTLENIVFNISWKEEGNYQKMKEIVETDQWKQANTIFTRRVTSLRIDDLLQYGMFSLKLDSVTPEDVLRCTEHVFSSKGRRHCGLYTEDFDINATIDFLCSRIDGSRIIRADRPAGQENLMECFRFRIEKSGESVWLRGSGTYVAIDNFI